MSWWPQRVRNAPLGERRLKVSWLFPKRHLETWQSSPWNFLQPWAWLKMLLQKCSDVEYIHSYSTAAKTEMLPIADSKHLQKELEKYSQYSPKGGKISNISSYLFTHHPWPTRPHCLQVRCSFRSRPQYFCIGILIRKPKGGGIFNKPCNTSLALGDKWFAGCCVWYFLDGRYLVRNELMQNPELYKLF